MHRPRRQSDEQSPADSSRRDPHEPDCGVRWRKAAGEQSGDSELQCDECGRVIDQTFTLESGNDASRHGETFEHRGGCDGIGRRDDCAQSEGGSPR